MKQIFDELIKAASEARAEEIRADIDSTFGAEDASNLLMGWEKENPGYFEVLANDPPALANQLKKFRQTTELRSELEKMRKETGEEIIKKVKNTLKKVEKLRAPVETGNRSRNTGTGDTRLLRNIINSLTN
ncbi:MAG: hypothetical protein K8F28_02030 [Ignavibacteriaceae bacterium]|nr:hypothetical protein [Ignavibacteriaceae bacterium]